MAAAQAVATLSATTRPQDLTAFQDLTESAQCIIFPYPELMSLDRNRDMGLAYGSCLYVLSYTGAGDHRQNYRMDIDKPNGQFLTRLQGDPKREARQQIVGRLQQE